MDTNNVFKNTLLLTLSGIIAKTVDFFFRAHYSKLLGAEGCGLLSLVFSVHSIMLTLATAGISVATSKLVSAAIAERNAPLVKSTMKSALLLTFFSSVAVMVFSACFSGFIANDILKDERCKMPLLCLLPSVLFMSISYCLKGYFYASRKILIPASSEFLEQLVKISLISFFLSKALPFGTTRGCMAIFAGLSFGELSSCTYLLCFYKNERKKFKNICPTKGSAQTVIKTALPAMASSISGSYLHMTEELLTVSGLKKYGYNQKDALSVYGALSGMVVPLIMFPLSLLSSFLTLLVPEISRAAARSSKTRLKDLCKKVYKFSSVLSFLIFSVYFSFSSEIGKAVYGNKNLGAYIAVFSLLLPLNMTDSVSCGILNGLGKQTTLFALTLCEAFIRLFLCAFFVPLCGTTGIIRFFFFGGIFSFSLRLLLVLSHTSAKPSIKKLALLPALSSAFACILSRVVFLFWGKKVLLPAKIFFCVSAYVISSFAFKNITKRDFLWAYKRLKGERIE